MLAALLEELQSCRQPTGHAPSRAHACLLPCEHCGPSTVGPDGSVPPARSQWQPRGEPGLFLLLAPGTERPWGRQRGVPSEVRAPWKSLPGEARARPLGVLGAGQAQIQAPSPGPLGIWSHSRLLGESPRLFRQDTYRPPRGRGLRLGRLPQGPPSLPTPTPHPRTAMQSR